MCGQFGSLSCASDRATRCSIKSVLCQQLISTRNKLIPIDSKTLDPSPPVAKGLYFGIEKHLPLSTDKLRRAYAHYPEGIPRRTIIVGSTNEENCLPSDPAGNRRFVSVRVDGPLALPDRIRTELPEMRDQMWAEGLERYRKGETSHFPTALKSVLASDSEQHEYKDEVLETDVADHGTTDTGAIQGHQCAEEIRIHPLEAPQAWPRLEDHTRTRGVGTPG